MIVKLAMKCLNVAVNKATLTLGNEKNLLVQMIQKQKQTASWEMDGSHFLRLTVVCGSSYSCGCYQWCTWRLKPTWLPEGRIQMFTTLTTFYFAL
jgi:hypothetical protein